MDNFILELGKSGNVSYRLFKELWQYWKQTRKECDRCGTIIKSTVPSSCTCGGSYN